MNNFPTDENIRFVEAHTCFQLFNFVCLAVISLKVSAKFTRNRFKNISASFLLTSYDFILFYFWQYCSSVSSCLLVHAQYRISSSQGRLTWFSYRKDESDIPKTIYLDSSLSYQVESKNRTKSEGASLLFESL